MMDTARRMMLVLLGGVIGTQTGPATASAQLMTSADGHYQARCTGESWAGPVECLWAGEVRNNVSSALSDLVHHQNTVEHIATIEHLPKKWGG